MNLEYPLNITFKVISWGPQMTIRDANGKVIMYVHQKAMKLKEAVTVYTDETRSLELFKIKADRVIDFSAKYNFYENTGEGLVGAIKRKGMRSFWKANYSLFVADSENPAFEIEEEDVITRIADGCISEIPILSMFSGYLFHPAYKAFRPGGETVMRIQKQPAFFEGKFKIEKLTELDAMEEKSTLLGLMMTVLIERFRG